MFEDTGLKDAVREAEQSARPRLAALNQTFMVIGREVSFVLIIFLALAILCAPTGLGLAAAWLAGIGVVALTGSVTLGVIAGVVVVLFFGRYVWGSRLQGAAKQAVAALLVSRAS